MRATAAAMGLFLFVCAFTHAGEGTAPPDSSAIYEEASTSEERVLFETGFEEAEAQKLVHYYAGNVPNKVVFTGVTDEEAHSGKHSFKMQVEFEAGRWGNAYFKLPAAIPQWSDLHARFYVKMDTLPKTWSFHGFVGAQASVPTTGNNINGEKKGEDNGWEIWEVRASQTSDIGDYVEGIGLRMQLPDHSPATTVTMYIDDVEITGKLPSNYKEKWAAVYRYFTVDRENYMRELATRRLGGMKARYARQKREFRKVALPTRTSEMINDRYSALCGKIEADLAAVGPMIELVERNLADSDARFTAKLDEAERILAHLSIHVEAARSYPAYARKFGGEDIISFTLEPTQSYEILPAGPEGHNEELSHYSWSGGGFENPQLLPDAKVIPAAPSREMGTFGCRGTTVQTSFAVLPASNLVDAVVEVSDLASGLGRIGADTVDVRVVATWYRPFEGGARLMNEMLLHDAAFVTPLADKKENAFEDPLYGNDTERLEPMALPSGELRQFFVTIKIPGDAAEGTYRGVVKVKAANHGPVELSLAVEVLPFDLEPTPYAYSFFYRVYPADAESIKASAEKFQVKRTPEQMEAELVGMAEHGCNTLNLYVGAPTKTEEGWDFSALDACLAMAKRAGLTRSPFTWLAHNQYFLPMPERDGAPKTMDEVVANFKDFVPAVNAFCDERGYPRPGLFGHDEASGEALMKLRRGYGAVNDAGGIVTVACYPSFFDEIGDALSLPIIYGGGQTMKGREAMRKSQALGYECWIYNCPATSLPASPSVYRRRYGLAMWRNGERGAAPWEYAGVPRQREGEPPFGFNNVFTDPLYAVAYPTWSGKPIDTIIYEAWREGITDTRYMATLEKALAQAKEAGGAPELVAKVEKWLETFSINDDLQKVRWQMADFIVALGKVAE